jgi:hypothetical protein
VIVTKERGTRYQPETRSVGSQAVPTAIVPTFRPNVAVLPDPTMSPTSGAATRNWRVPVGGGGVVGGGVVGVIEIATVLADVAPVTFFVATVLSADSRFDVVRARTAKYHVPGVSDWIVAWRAVTSLTVWDWLSELAEVP